MHVLFLQFRQQDIEQSVFLQCMHTNAGAHPKTSKALFARVKSCGLHCEDKNNKTKKPILQMHLLMIIEKQFHWVIIGHRAFEIQVTKLYYSLSSHVWFDKRLLSESHCKKFCQVAF